MQNSSNHAALKIKKQKKNKNCFHVNVFRGLYLMTSQIRIKFHFITNNKMRILKLLLHLGKQLLNLGEDPDAVWIYVTSQPIFRCLLFWGVAFESW